VIQRLKVDALLYDTLSAPESTARP
jgi:hypothetical protein